jgi:membrane protein DedA with SNARE-associated domain
MALALACDSDGWPRRNPSSSGTAPAVFIGRFIGFARALVPFVAGASRIRYRQFVAYDALGAVLWTLVFVTLGYVLGASWRVAERWIGRSSMVLATIALLVGVVAWYRRSTRPAPPI